MLGKSARCFANQRFEPEPGKVYIIGGLLLPPRSVRRRARAIEKRAWRRDPLNRLYNTSV